MSKLTQELADEIADLIAEGRHTVTAICEAVKIGRKTYYRWIQAKEPIGDETFDTIVKKAHERAKTAQADIAVSSFIKTLEGYDYEESTTEIIPADPNAEPGSKESKPQIKTRKVVKKHQAPSPAVVIFAMKNYYPEQFKDKIEVEGKELTFEEAFAIKYGKKATASN